METLSFQDGPAHRNLNALLFILEQCQRPFL
jgi:hypothetical protein